MSFPRLNMKEGISQINQEERAWIEVSFENLFFKKIILAESFLKLQLNFYPRVISRIFCLFKNLKVYKKLKQNSLFISSLENDGLLYNTQFGLKFTKDVDLIKNFLGEPVI